MTKSVLRTKNMFALGMVYWLFDRKFKNTGQFFENKFHIEPERNPDSIMGNTRNTGT
jgi:hypothetical protein